MAAQILASHKWPELKLWGQGQEERGWKQGHKGKVSGTVGDVSSRGWRGDPGQGGRWQASRGRGSWHL